MSVQPIAPAARPPASPPAGEDGLFRFYPRASNPELWRTTVPLAVRQGCGRHKGLISTWMAIHWLIVLHASNGRRAFGMRAIAAEAGVGRNELAGPQGYIQRLVNLGLLAIVGYEAVPGMREPRPIYHIDLSELEARSLELVPAILREHRLPPPPRPAPDPRQLALFGADPPPSGTGHPQTGTDTLGNGTVSYPGFGTDRPAIGTVYPETRTDQRALTTAHPGFGTGDRPETGIDTHGDRAAAPETGTALPSFGPDLTDRDTTLHETGTARLPAVTGAPETGPGLSRKGDVDRENEREKDRESESAPAPNFIHQIAAQAIQAVLQTLARQGILTGPQDRAVIADEPPATPEGQPELPDDLVALWRGDRTETSARDRHQLTILARELNRPTDGYGAYWVGRAILLADRCLSERGQPVSINYLRTMLRRWQREDSWGSDLETEPASELLAGRQHQRQAPSEPTASAHPAVAAYSAAFGRTPNTVQAAQIGAAVTDVSVWQRVLTEWLANGWQAGAVAKMIDRYTKDTAPAAPAPDTTPVSITPIYHHPGLSDPQRDRWILRFHAATSLAEKRALLAQLAQEHPL